MTYCTLYFKENRSMKTTELSRKELYDLVWSTSLSKLTQQYALSNDGIKKICKQFEIPMPDSGYWMKLKFNKTVEKEQMNNNYAGEDKIILTIREEGSDINTDQSELTILTKQILNDKKAPLVVPKRLTNPDILTVRTKEYWDKRHKDRFYYDHSLFILPIRVEQRNEDRALRFMDTLIKLIRHRGHDIIRRNFETIVVVDNIEIEIDLREANKRVASTEKYRDYDYVPTGEFILKTGKYWRIKEWRDSRIKLEDQLAKIVAKLEIDALREKDFQEEIRINNLKYEEKRQIEEAIKKRREDEVKKFNKLLALSEQYNKAQLIRQYIEAERQKAVKEKCLTTEKQEWIDWANDKADWYDPTINKPDDILDV